MAHRVVVLAVDDVVGFDLGVPGQVFGAARDGAGVPLYQVTTCTEGGRPVRSSGGCRVLPDHDLGIVADADTVVVPGIHGGPPLTAGTVSEPVARALRDAHTRGARVVSICTGAAVLAAAGGGESKEPYRAVFDNAFGLTEGGD
ncbi:MAG TPA: DJ-1/PfpI family protein, partial [Catenuloplanes sp.]